MSEKLFSKAVMGVGLSFVLGAGFGIAVENNTNEVASGKATTARTCLESIPHESQVTKELEHCLESGVPGGRKIGDDKFKQGNPVAFVEGYISAQKQESDIIEVGRVVGWSASPVIAAVIGGGYLLL